MGDPSRLCWTLVHVPSCANVHTNRPEFSLSRPGSVIPAARRSSFVIDVVQLPISGKPLGAGTPIADRLGAPDAAAGACDAPDPEQPATRRKQARIEPANRNVRTALRPMWVR